MVKKGQIKIQKGSFINIRSFELPFMLNFEIKKKKKTVIKKDELSEIAVPLVFQEALKMTK